jgi:hypothetical protein
MYKITSKAILITLILSCFVFSNFVFAVSWQNERIRNRTGGTANNLEKWLQGEVAISEWFSTHFTSFSYVYNTPGNYTKLTWTDGTVPNGTWCGACIKTDQKKIKHKYLPRWSYAKTDSVAGPALSQEFAEQGKGLLGLVISNTAEDGGTITIDTIQVGIVTNPLPIYKLFYDSLGSVSWLNTNTNYPLALNGSLIFAGYYAPSGQALIYRAKVHLNTAPSNVVEYAGQYIAEKNIPTLTEWSIIILVVLLMASALFILLKRRNARVTA